MVWTFTNPLADRPGNPFRPSKAAIQKPNPFSEINESNDETTDEEDNHNDQTDGSERSEVSAPAQKKLPNRVRVSNFLFYII